LKNSLLILVLLLTTNTVQAQDKLYLIEFSNPPNLSFKPRSGKADSSVFLLEVQKIKNGLLSEGHLLANIDMIQFDQDTLLAVINVGDKYNWLALGTNNIPEEMLSKAGYRKRDFQGTEFSINAFNRLVTRILDNAANSGYPFASLQLTEVEVVKNSVKGILDYLPGPIIYYDSLTVSPQNFIKPKFLSSYLATKEGSLFQIKDLANIENSINKLSYCQLGDSVQLSFQNNLCNINFKLNPIKANKIDALIGFLPNQKLGEGLLITGFVNLQLQNLFRSGKELSFVWRQFQQQSQKLFVLYKHPNLFHSPLGISMGFDLLKQDTSFLNTNFNIEGYYLYKKMEISFITSFKSSRSLSTPVDTLELPEAADYNLQLLGARTMYNSLSNINNPLRGATAFIEFRVGNKQIKKNTGIAEAVYDSINLRSIQFEGTIGGEINQQIIGPFVLHIDLSLGTIFNDDQLFTNDLIRLGGVNSLRGFNDLELFVSSYALARLEGRIIINSNSRLFLFYDQALTKNIVANINDQPRGFGAGLMLDTGVGNLQLVYALGVSGQQSLSLTQSKIHIGYVARF
jgi:translocation and assembly module TamA